VVAALSSPKKSSSAAPSPSPVTTSSSAASTPSLNAQTSQTFLSTPDAFALSFEDDDIDDPEDNHSTPPGGMRQEVTGNFYPHQPTATVPPPANRKSTLSTLTPARPIDNAAPRPSQQIQRPVPQPVGQVQHDRWDGLDTFRALVQGQPTVRTGRGEIARGDRHYTTTPGKAPPRTAATPARAASPPPPQEV
jgi:hypothetical protein